MKLQSEKYYASIKELIYLRDIWIDEFDRLEVGLCPNCLSRIRWNEPHSSWCLIKRTFSVEKIK